MLRIEELYIKYREDTGDLFDFAEACYTHNSICFLTEDLYDGFRTYLDEKGIEYHYSEDSYYGLYLIELK